jgi:hypothetical protein
LPASTPVLFVIDGDPGVANALRDDLSRRFGREFRIVCESAANAGLAALCGLAVRRVPVALLVVGQDLGDERRCLPRPRPRDASAGRAGAA